MDMSREAFIKKVDALLMACVGMGIYDLPDTTCIDDWYGGDVTDGDIRGCAADILDYAGAPDEVVEMVL